MKYKVIIIFVIIGFTLVAGLTMVLKDFKRSGESNFPVKLPAIVFSDMNGDIQNLSNDPTPKKILIFFNTTCDYCEKKAEVFKSKHTDIKDFSIFWISNEETETIENFRNTYDLNNKPNINFLQDSEGYSFTHFGVKTVPVVLFFFNGQLIRHFENEAPIGYIIDQINNYH